MRRATLVTTTALLWSSALACSGPGAQESMLMARAFGTIALGIQAILAVIMYILYRKAKRGPGHPVVGLVLLAIHPNWYVSVYSGDCGIGLETLVVGMALLVAVLFFWQASLIREAGAQI